MTFTRLAAGALLLLCELVHPYEARAQFDAGPPKLRVRSWEIEPAFAISSGENTNVQKESGNLQVKAIETVAIPHVDIRWIRPGQSLQAYYANEFAFYGASKTGTGSTALVPRARNTFGDVTYNRTAVISPTLRYVHWNFGARASDYEEVAARSRRVEDTYSGALTFGTGRTVSFNTDAALVQTRYDADAVFKGNALSEKLNFYRRTVGGTITVRLTPLTSAGVGGMYMSDQFLVARARNTNSSIANGFITFAPRAMFSGTISLGLKSAGAPDPGAQPFLGPVLNTTLDYKLKRATLVMFSASRDTSYSFDAAKSYYITTDVNVALEQALSNRIETSVLVNRLTLNYRGVARGTDTQLGYGGGLRVVVRPWFRLGVSLDHISRSGVQPWRGTRIVAFSTYGTRFKRLERPMPGDSYQR